MILRIALLLVVLLVLPALYIDRAFVRRPGWRLLLWSPNALLALATLWFVLFEGFGDNEVVLKGLYLVVLLAVTVTVTQHLAAYFTSVGFSPIMASVSSWCS